MNSLEEIVCLCKTPWLTLLRYSASFIIHQCYVQLFQKSDQHLLLLGIRLNLWFDLDVKRSSSEWGGNVE